jgi:DNA-directed RNA polymerase subunit RPC12/RpoP
MSFPIKTCVVCGEEFELKPDKPGFANRCPECSSEETETEKEKDKRHLSAEERKAEAEANAERRKAIRDLLYKKDR